MVNLASDLAAHGHTQGYALSPTIFNIVMDFLRALLNKVEAEELLSDLT